MSYLQTGLQLNAFPWHRLFKAHWKLIFWYIFLPYLKNNKYVILKMISHHTIFSVLHKIIKVFFHFSILFKTMWVLTSKKNSIIYRIIHEFKLKYFWNRQFYLFATLLSKFMSAFTKLQLWLIISHVIIVMKSYCLRTKCKIVDHLCFNMIIPFHRRLKVKYFSFASNKY